jgi:hypothetical protein
MASPRLNVSRRVKCPCGGLEVGGSPSELVRKAQELTLCPNCGRRFGFNPYRRAGGAVFAFITEGLRDGQR